MKKKRLQKVVALLMVVAMVLNLTPSGLTISLAADNAVTGEKTSDALTNADWENQMSQTDSYSSENVGRIWTDKSVATDDVTLAYGDLKGTVIEMADDADFLVELSAMSSTSSQTTTTTSSAPVDVVFVIDLSGSMSNSSSNMSNGYSRIYNLVQALNSSIGELMEANEYNRIAVVGYSSTSVTLLPLDHYTKYTSEGTTYNYFSLDRNTGSNSNATLTVNAVNSSGSRVNRTQSVSGGTNIQRGIYTGMNILASVENEDVTVEINGTTYNRTPVVIILSDGAATYSASDTNWWNITSTNSNQGDGQNAYYGNGFKAMITAAYMKQAISRNYNEDASVYTIGVGVSSLSTNEQTLATLTLNPSNYSSGSTVSTTASSYSWRSTQATGQNANNIGYNMYTAWNSYVANRTSVSVTVGNNTSYSVTHPSSNDIIALDENGNSVTSTVNGVTINSGILYNDAYYDVTNASDMSLVFEEITSSIAASSVASPTKVTTGSETTSGYVSFTDTLGEFMEVKDFEAIVVEGQKFETKTVSEEIDNGDGSYTTTYTFTGTVEGNVVYSGGDLEDLVITVTSYDDPSKGDVVEVKIPATLLPLLYYDINTTGTGSTMSISEDYPLRVFYSVGLKDGVKTALTSGDYDSVTGLASYVAENTDDTTGLVSFYSNYYDATETDDGSTIGDTTVWFEPAATNSFYYFQEDTALYTSSGNSAVLASYSDIRVGATYYYKHEYYYNTEETTTDPTTQQPVTTTVAVAGTNWVAVTLTEEEIASYVKDDGDGNAVISAGSPKLPLGESSLFQGEKSTSENATGTADYYLYPTWTEGGNAYTYLGNNGEITYSSTGSLAVSKTVTADTDLNPSSETAFTFTVTFTGATGSYSYYKVDAQGNKIADSDGTITSGGTLTLLDGQSAVIYGLPHGAGYTVTETNLPNGYTTNSTGSGTIVGGETQTAAFTNVYKPNSVTYDGTMSASKTLTGRAWDADDSFIFYLTPVDTTVLPTSAAIFTTTDGATVTVTQGTVGTSSATSVIYTVTKGTADIADGQSVAFNLGTFTFDEPGTYTYRVTEHEGTEAGVTYSDAIYTIVFTVTDDGSGQLKVSAVMTQNYDDNYTATNTTVTSNVAAFGNTYNAGAVSFNVTANKTLNDTVALSGSYEFTFTALNGSDGVKLPSTVTATSDNTDADGNVTWTVTNVESGRILSGDITVEASDAGNTYEYLVQEVIPTDAVDNNDGTWTYQGNIVTFDTSVYKYSYTVTYVNGVVGYSLAVYRQNASNGWVEVQGATTASFANTAEVTVGKDGEASIQVQKELDGRGWLESDSFTFVLTPADSSTPMPSDGNGGQLTTATVSVSSADSAANYTEVFADITYTAAGTYTYTLAEIEPADADKIPGIAYDKHSVTVTVTVTDMGSYLSASVSYSTGETVPVFTNTYEAEEVVLPTADAQFAVKKVLEGREWVSTDQFTFTLTAGTNTAGVTTPMPERNSVTATITNQSPAFTGEVTYDTAGDYTYYIREAAGASDVGLAYDATVWKVVVHIEDDYSTGKLTASMSYYKGTEDNVTTDTGWTEVAGTNPITFTNTYTATPATLSRVGGEKTLVGRDMEDGETFTFTLTPTGTTATAVANGVVQLPGYTAGASDNPTTATVTVSGMTDGGTQAFSFGTITFTKVGDYTFAITETSGSDSNTQYDGHTTYATVTVYDDTTGALHAYVRYMDNDYSFTNVSSTNTKTVTSDTDEDGVAEDVDGQMVEAGQELTYTINWVNSAYTDGVPAAATVTIEDSIPTGTVLDESSLTGVAGTGPTDENPVVYTLTKDVDNNVTAITWTIKAAAAESGEVSFTVKVSEDASSATAIENKATVKIGENSYDTNETTNYVPLTLDNLFQVQKKIVDASGNTISAGTYPWTVVAEYDDTDSDEEYWFRFAMEAISAPNGVDLESILPGGTKTDVSPDSSQNPLVADNIYSSDTYNFGDIFGSVTYTEEGTYEYDLWERSPIMAAAAEGSANTGDPIPGVSYSQALYRVTVKVEFNETKGVLEVAEYTITLVTNDAGTSTDETKYTTTSYSDADNSYVMVITNTYNKDEEMVAFRGIKSYTDTSGATTLAEGDFSFKFTAVTEGAPVPTGVTADANGVYSWTVDAAANGQFTSTDITYKPEDVETYYYRVDEVLPDGAYDDDDEKDGFQYENMTYDTNAYYVKVVVTYVDTDENGTADTVEVSTSYVVGTEDGQGGVTEDNTQSAPVTSYGRIEFVNTYDPDDVDVDTKDVTDGFGLKKTIEGRTWIDTDEFTFTLTAGSYTDLSGNAGSEEVPMPAVAETNNGVVTATATVKGTDTQDTYGAIAIDFGTVTYSKVGVYTYTVTEDATTIDGVTIDSVTRTITVTVKLDANTDALYVDSIVVEADDTVDDAKEFTNTYESSGTYTGLSLKKTLTGRNMKGSEFTFEIAASGETEEDVEAAATELWLANLTSLQSDTSYIVANTAELAGKSVDIQILENLSFTQADARKTYTYMVQEQLPTDDDTETEGIQSKGVTYDQSVYQVVITLTDDNAGNITATATITRLKNADGTDAAVNGEYPDVTSAGISFKNTYAATGTLDGSSSLKVAKTLTGRAGGSNEEFTFQLTAGSYTDLNGTAGTVKVPMPAANAVSDGNGGYVYQTTVSAPTTKDGTSTGAFGDITFTETGIYTYTITEVEGSNAITEWSGAEYTVTVKVTDNEDGTLKVEVTGFVMTKDQSGDNSSETISDNTATFVNTYVEKEQEKEVTTDISGVSTEVNGQYVSVGSTLTYTIDWYNTAVGEDGNAAVATIKVVDAVPTGTSYVAGSLTWTVKNVNGGVIDTITPTTSTENGEITVTFDNVPANGYGTVSFTVEVTEDAYDAGSVENEASITVGDHEPVHTNTVENQIPTKEVSDADGNDIDGQLVGVGDTLTYTIDWVNTAVDTDEESMTYGSPVAATITITDTVPTGTSVDENSIATVIGSGSGTATVKSATYDASTKTITWIIEAKAAAYGSVSFDVTVTEDAVNNNDQAITNHATVKVGENKYDTNETTNYVPKKTAELDSGSNTLKVGDVITYSIVFRNTAATAESIIEVEDVLAVGLAYVADSATVQVGTGTATAIDTSILGDAASGETLTWKLTGTEVGATVTITFKVEVTEDADANVANQAIVDGHDSNHTITPVPAEDEKHALDSEGNIIDGETVSAGDVLTYQISWTNEIVEVQDDNTVMKSYADTVTVKDILPAGVTVADYDDAGAANVKYDPNDGENGSITWTFEGLSTEKMERGTVTFTVTVDGTDGTIENEALITANDYEKTALVTNTVPVKEVYDAEDTTITADGEVVYVGSILSYEVSYKNLSKEDEGTADMVITDAAPAGTAYVEGSAKGTVTDAAGKDITDSITIEVSVADDGTIAWSYKEVPAGATITATFDVTVTEAALENAGNRVENQAEVTIGGDDPVSTRKVVNYVFDKDVALSSDPTTSVDGQTVGVGDTLTYTIDWANTAEDAAGNPAAAKVVVTDNIPSGTVLVPGSVPASGAESVHYIVNENGGYYETIETAEKAAEVIAIEWIFDAAAGESGTVSFKVTVSEEAATTNKITNTAEVRVGDDDPVSTNEATNYVPRDPEKTIAEGSAGYADAETVTYDADAETYTYADVAVGDTIEYVISYYNHNPEAADVIITDTLDPGVVYVEGSATDGGVYNAETRTVTWTISGVAAQTEGTVSFKVTVTSEAKNVAEGETTATVENTASVQIGNDAAVDTSTVENPIEPDPEETPKKTITTEGVSNGDTVAVGDELTYEIRFYNHTNEVATVTITDALDAGVDYVSSTEGGVYDKTTHTVTWTLEVAPFTEGSVSVTIQVNESAVTQIANTAYVKIENESGSDTDTENPGSTDEPDEGTPTNTVTNPVKEEEPEPTPTEPEPTPTDATPEPTEPASTEPVPTTSDTEAVVPYTVMMLMAFMAIVILLKSRRKENA